MSQTYHILNGDALKAQFPKEIEGKLIIARECLVDGPVNGKTLDEFFQNRAKFIADLYGDYSEADYLEETVGQFSQMLSIVQNAEIMLWFEDDLFCQINLWFICHLISRHLHKVKVFLVRPPEHSPYGFGALNQKELLIAYSSRTQIDALDTMASLWIAYQNDDLEKLEHLAKSLEDAYPFILPAVMAHLERIPSQNNPGRPIRSLVSIMRELKTEKFGPIFQEFCKREAIYGFGDLQVKKLYDKIKDRKL